MALKIEGRISFLNPSLQVGSSFYGANGNYVKGGLRNRFTSLDQYFSAYENGALAPSAFILPQKSGSISSYTLASENIVGSANLTPAIPMSASSSMNITVSNAQLDRVMQLALSGSISISASANLASAVTMSASDTISISANANLGGIFSINASKAISISGANSVISALAFMLAEAGGPTPLSPEGLSSELLDNQDIEDGYSLRESMRLVLSSLSGKVSGAETTTITFRNVNDDKNRIIATVDANGNRTALTYDVSD